VTIDVADLRKRAERTFPQVYPSELAELLDAYEERDRLREWLVRLRTRMAEPQQPIIQWDAGTWIERIDAALEGRE
jgi:hypothetical protein